jgi:hypothetical protein
VVRRPQLRMYSTANAPDALIRPAVRWVRIALSGVFLSYSATAIPEPPSSAGKSFIFGSPSFMRSTVSE